MMKKKIIAALCAAIMAVCGLCAPVSAESTYKKGDVNMDGKVDVDDAQLILQEYCCAGVVAMPLSFTEEQMELAAITGRGTKIPRDNVDLPFSVADAQTVLAGVL